SMILEQRSRVADAAIFCDFGYGMITTGLLNRSLPALRQNVPILAADVSGQRGNLLQFRNVDLLCPTEREVRAALNDYESGLSAAAWQTLHLTQARHIFVTLEKRGLVAFERRSQERATLEWEGRLKGEQLPSFARYATDRLGCGDALLAVSALALTAGAGLMQSAYMGNVAAAIEIDMLGNHPVDFDSYARWLRNRCELEQSETMPEPAPTAF
ncbi:MAG: PfkB family carbohydrate kinase, partial [bacterium]